MNIVKLTTVDKSVLLARKLRELWQRVQEKWRTGWLLCGALGELLRESLAEGDAEPPNAALRYMTLANPHTFTPLAMLGEIGAEKGQARDAAGENGK